MHATGYMASVWLTDERTNTQDLHTYQYTHTHTPAYICKCELRFSQAHLVGFVLFGGRIAGFGWNYHTDWQRKDT